MADIISELASKSGVSTDLATKGLGSIALVCQKEPPGR